MRRGRFDEGGHILPGLGEAEMLTLGTLPSLQPGVAQQRPWHASFTVLLPRPLEAGLASLTSLVSVSPFALKM